jgi:probable HAF family extracellular repeat protein
VDLPAQTLVYSATGLPDGASFNPATREFVWTPTEAQGPGTYGVTFTLTDGVATTTETLAITVNEVNVAPVLAPIGNRTIDELQLLSFIATATDNDVPANSLTFSLENGVAGLVPTGASINPTTGEFTWTPTEAQGPGSYTFDVVVTDNGSPILSDRETITVTVHEVNVAPVLAPIGNQTIDERVLFTFTASATDADLPANSLSFSLENGLAGLVPTGASINPTTGEFTWTPTEAQGPASYTFDVVVTDNGSPILSDRETITITVNETITNTFQGLGDLPGGWLYDSHAVGDFFNETPGMGISADGSRIAVNANLFPNEHQDPLNPGPLTGGNTPIIWDATAGLLSPFVIPVGYRYPTITAISADGSTVVGTIGLVNGGAVAFVARQGTDLVLLGDLPDGSPGGPNAGATAVSADGSVVVGYRYLPSSGQEAFRWTASGGMQSLDSFDVATAVSADGMVIVGYRGTVGDREALRWTASTGTQGLGDLPGGSFYSMPTGLSADGSVIVGDSESALDGVNTSLAFRWTVSDGMQGLGDLPGGIVFSSATAVSADGNVIVGRSNSGVQEAFRWTAAGGMQGLGYSTDTSIWFSQATGVSADGNVVVGLENGGAFRWTASEGLQRISTPDFGVASVVGVSADGNVIAGRGNSLLHPEYPREAWRWSTTGGFVTISSQPNVGNYSQVGYVSSDGTVVAGTSSSAAGTEAFRWTEADGMQSLGDLPGGHWYTLSVATGISGDGSTIIGYSESDDGMQAFRWTAADGMQGLGDLPGYTFFSMATGVSADGSVVVGYSMSDSGEEAFRWTATDGMQGLGALPGGLQSRAVAVSADGSVIIGYGSSTSGTQAFRWTASGGMEGLGDLPGGQFFSQPTAVSANGSVIVGYSYSTVVYPEAFRWTASGGMQGLGDLPEGDFHSRATGVSADGTVVMGYGFSASGQEAFRWTVSDGMQGLGDLPGGAYYSNPTSMSADGSVIVGASVSASGYEAFYWSTSTGMVRLEDLLGVNYGLAPQFSGWTLQPTFLTISSDGKTLLGNGYNPDRWREAWMAFLDGAII